MSNSCGEPPVRKDWLYYVEIAVMLFICVFFGWLVIVISGCRVVQDAAIGTVAGAATGTPQGALGGAAGGAIVGLWEDIKAIAVKAWAWMFGGSSSAATAKGPIATASEAARYELWRWILLAGLVMLLMFTYRKRRWILSLFRKRKAIIPTHGD